MSFEVGAQAYGRFMGRFAEPLAAQFAALAGLTAGQHALDVGCGPGALTAELVARLGPEAVSAVDPSTSFVHALRERLPSVRVRRASAEDLPFADRSFDATMAQLVVHFMDDPVRGLSEMARVTRSGGVVATCVWDQAGGTGPLAGFWRAVRESDPDARDESDRPGVREGHLGELFRAAGLPGARTGVLTVRVGFAGFDEWWEPFTLGVGPAGSYVASLDARRRDDLRRRCAAVFETAGPFDITASAWSAVARVP